MWRYFKNTANGNLEIDHEKSFFWGDSAGRETEDKKDNADSDYRFALNWKLKFYTPEMYFLGIEETLPDLEVTMAEFKDKEIETLTSHDKK